MRGRRLFTGALLWIACGVLSAQQDDLYRGFQSPPDSARPRTWWHWTNGNVTKEGITKDLEWMHRVGIGGFQLVDVAAGGGQTVAQKINFGTPEWYDAVHHAATEAKRLGLEMSLFSSPGWSEAGGPWVKPEDGMKRLVWSETHLHGPGDATLALPMPPSDEGPVRDLHGANAKLKSFYRDSAVIAYRTPPDEQRMQDLHPRASTDAGPVDSAPLLDDSLNTGVEVQAPRDGSPAWLQYAFDKPYTARALTLGCHNRIPVGRVLVSDDGKNWRTVVTLPGPEGYHGAPVRTFAFPAITGHIFRIELDGAGLLPAAVIHGGDPVPAPRYTLTEAIFSSGARVNRWEDKGAFGSLMDRYDVAPTPQQTSTSEIASETIVDLTSRLDEHGVLHWKAPEGDWTILRFGSALTGARNRPATPAGSGYEVDKLDADAVSRYLHGYLDPIRAHLGPDAGVVQYMTMDSWEAGMQNWSPAVQQQFRRSRGYDAVPFLPVLAGHVVGSAETSDRFLWDFRRTLADLYASAFYGSMDAGLHAYGMKAYAEASGVALEIPEDTLLNKSRVDVPMAEFWVHALHPESIYYMDVRGAASAAHAYGKPIVAAEAFTGGGYDAPYTLKRVADYWFAQGINRLVFHTSAHQPLDTLPGNTMVGTHLHRKITWAEQAGPFVQYLARLSYLLQQGQPVADIAYLLPEGSPSTMPFWGSGLQPAPPSGYDYDFINTDLLLHHAHVIDGGLQLDSGMHYRLLVLPPTQEMTPQVAHKLQELVAAGLTVSGPRPKASPSLVGGANADRDVTTVATDLWGDADGVTKTQHSFGKGRIYDGLAPSDVLQRLALSPDFDVRGDSFASPVWIHRRLSDRDIYYIANQADTPTHLVLRLRAVGRSVSLWRPMTGERATLSASVADGSTIVSLDLAERETAFVVFSGSALPAHATLAPRKTVLTAITAPWTVAFHGPAAPPPAHLAAGTSWTESADSDLKYFSGTGTYTRDLEVQRDWLRPGRQLVLDLGRVGDLAEVRVNGKLAGTVWAPPYQLNITPLLHVGRNHITVAVTNEFSNRILGDKLLPEKDRVLGGAADQRAMFGSPTSPLPSGLLGVVRLLALDPVNESEGDTVPIP